MTNNISMNCSAQQLEQLKLYFQKEIDSKRTFSRIQSIYDLRKVLVKRNCNLTLLDNKLYEIRRNDNDVLRPLNEPPIMPNIPLDTIERIDQLIAMEIGQKWKDLARALRISEGKIDEFCLISPRLEEIIRDILRYHRNNVPYWKTSLCEALQKARRTDLSLHVQNILEYNYML